MSGVGNAGLKLIHADTGIKSCPIGQPHLLDLSRILLSR